MKIKAYYEHTMIWPTIFFVSLTIIGAGCQKKPTLPATPPPMGATTYNDELEKELTILDKLLDNTIEAQTKKKVSDALMNGKTKGQWKQASDEDYLARVYLALPELVHPKEALSDTHKLWYKSKLLFLRRRFIEAATSMSELLKKEPTMTIARNWRARAIFFLGNPDLAIQELQIIVSTEPKRSQDHLDALYLIGAIVYESQDLDKKRLNTGINAWTNYLALSDPDLRLKSEITNSLNELNQRLAGDTLKAPADIFLASENYSAQKNAILQSFKDEELLLAEKLCEQALNNNYDRDLAVIKARIYIKSGRIDEAALLFDQIVLKDKLYAPGFHYRGMAYMMKGLIKEAIASWQEALNLDSAYARTHNLEQRIAVAQNMLQN